MFEKLKSIQQLPIFPLPVVLLPGMLMPLHIFEPRYRQMLHDCLQEHRLFGLTYHPDSTIGALVVPVIGSIGCVAHVMSVIPMQDERSNILTAGLCRYKTEEYISQEPYLVARVEFFEDETGAADVPADLIQEVSHLFLRFLEAMRILRDAPKSRYALPEQPEQLSFAIASAMLVQSEDQLEVLHMRSTEERFQFLRRELEDVIDDLESRATDHKAVKRNGHREIKLN